jgi:NhaA family Na+:H+ antiporter
MAVSVVAGIGFTVSIFISNLAFGRGDLVAEAKVAILAASALMGVAGYLALRLASPRAARDDALPRT